MIKKRNKILIVKIALFVLFLLVVIAMITFSNMPQVSDRAIVSMLGVDKDGEEIVVTAHMLISTSGIMEEIREDSVRVSAKSVEEALNRLSIVRGRKVELASAPLVVVGERLLEDGFLEVAQRLIFCGSVSTGAHLIACKGEVKEFMAKAMDLGEQTSEQVAKFVARFSKTLKMPKSTIQGYLSDELGLSRAAVIPIMQLEGREAEEGVVSTDIASINTGFVVQGGKKVGSLDEDEMLGFVLLQKESRTGDIVLENGIAIKIENKRVSVRSRSGGLTYNLRLKTDLQGIEKNELLKELNRLIEKALTKSKELDADFFGLEHRLTRATPAIINNFAEDIKVKVDIRVTA